MFHPNSGLSDHTAVVADVDIKASKTVKAPRIIFRWNDVDETEFVRGTQRYFPGKYLLLNRLIPGWLAKLSKFKVLAGKLKI